jgi:hypothetical protein
MLIFTLDSNWRMAMCSDTSAVRELEELIRGRARSAIFSFLALRRFNQPDRMSLDEATAVSNLSCILLRAGRYRINVSC